MKQDDKQEEGAGKKPVTGIHHCKRCTVKPNSQKIELYWL